MTSDSTYLGSIRDQPKLTGYYAVMSIVVMIFGALWLFEGYYLFTAWFPSMFDEITPINGVMAGAFMTLMLVCSVVSLFRPTSMIGPSKVLIVGAGVLGLTLPLAFLVDNPVLTIVLLLIAGSILALVISLHPGGVDVLPARRMEADKLLVGLTVGIAIPFLWMAASFQWSQITLDDEIAQRWFYGGYSMYLLTIVSLMVITSLDGATRRFTAFTVIFLTGILGLVSVVYPTELHSLGTIGGGLLLAWCAGVGLATVRR